MKGRSLRASSPIWASEASLARTRERGAAPRGFAARSRILARFVSLAQMGELARRLEGSLSCSRERALFPLSLSLQTPATQPSLVPLQILFQHFLNQSKVNHDIVNPRSWRE